MVLCLKDKVVPMPAVKKTLIGAWLKVKREEKDLTQMELAYLAGTTPATIQKAPW